MNDFFKFEGITENGKDWFWTTAVFENPDSYA